MLERTFPKFETLEKLIPRACFVLRLGTLDMLQCRFSRSSIAATFGS
ncbi:hypothetical protein [Algoriphagus confluentis]